MHTLEKYFDNTKFENLSFETRVKKSYNKNTHNDLTCIRKHSQICKLDELELWCFIMHSHDYSNFLFNFLAFILPSEWIIE